MLLAPAILLLLPLQQRPKGDRSRAQPEQRGASKTPNGQPDQGEDELRAGTLVTRPFLTNYRGALLIATCLAILAVDFPVFPRRFAKVETWGNSIMDLGVGNFVFSAGIVGARPVIREEQRSSTTTTAVRVNFGGRMLKALRHSLPLLLLGFARLLSVKNLDYAEHVTEYGVHWNFFFTLALLPPFVEAIDCCLAMLKTASSAPKPVPAAPYRSVRYDVVALLIATTYELILDNTGLLAFILVSPRTPTSSLLAKNREGVFSFFGYLAIFLSGRSTGLLTCQFQLGTPRAPTKRNKASDEQALVATERRRIVLPHLARRALTYAALYLVATHVRALDLTASRRLANLPYTLWTCAYNNAQLFLFAAAEAAGPSFAFTREPRARDVPSPLLRAFNAHGLPLFLLANLATGLVNLCVDTLDTRDAVAVAVLLAYAGVVCGAAVGLEWRRRRGRVGMEKGGKSGRTELRDESGLVD